jgi:hypothetical protein
VQIRDQRGTAFRIKLLRRSSGFAPLRWAQDLKDGLTLGGWFGGELSGDWKTLDEGFIRYRSGTTRSRFSEKGDLTTSDLVLLAPEGGTGIQTYDRKDLFGIQLFEYESLALLEEREGEGIVVQPWAINVTPGRIKWTVVDHS